MGNNEDGKSSKPEKSSLPAPQEQANLHIHPDWAAMQAYYGPQMAMAPYYSSAMAPGHPPPYMWGPAQHMMPPYGAPYATIYPHGGVYTHPPVPAGSPAPGGHGIPSSPMVTSPSSVQPSKIPSLGNNDQSLTKTVKGFNGLTMSTGKNVAATAKHKPSQSSGHEGSSDGSDGNTTETDETRKKRSREGSPTTGLEHEKHPTMNVKSNPSEPWFQNERELKREKRKQSNRESARRSRLRKQAETEELARKVESLMAENATLKCELSELAEKAEKLKEANAALGEKLKSSESGEASETILSRRGGMGAQNLVSSVDGGEGEMHINKESGVKLHQLMGTTSSRADAVAAS